MKYLIEQKRNVGFFSDFNLITAALTRLRENNIKDFSFIWNNILYSDNTNENLFNKYFFDTQEYDNYDVVYDIGDIAFGFFTHFNEHEIWLRANETLNYFNYFNNPVYKNCYEKCFKADNVLGVHVRGTDHGEHGSLIDIDYYFKQIDAELETNKFNSIFLATDENRIVDQFVTRYSSIVKVNSDITRSNTNQGIHFSNFTNKSQLAEEVLLDAISLANCKNIIITSSNVSSYTLCINPNVEYTFIDKHIAYH